MPSTKPSSHLWERTGQPTPASICASARNHPHHGCAAACLRRTANFHSSKNALQQLWADFCTAVKIQLPFFLFRFSLPDKPTSLHARTKIVGIHVVGCSLDRHYSGQTIWIRAAGRASEFDRGNGLTKNVLRNFVKIARTDIWWLSILFSSFLRLLCSIK